MSTVTTRPSAGPGTIAMRHLPFGLLAALIGLAPWFIGGARLPLQNLWASDTPPDAMPIVLVPFSQYLIAEVLGLLVLGGAVAGVLARLSSTRDRRAATLWTMSGLTLGYLTATVQTAVVVRSGLLDDGRGGLYFGAILTVIVIGGLTALGTAAAWGLCGRPGVSVAASFGALALATWIGELLAPGTTTPGPTMTELLTSLRWLPAVLVGVVLAWCGLRGGRHIGAWFAALALLWIVPAGLMTVQYAVGSRVLLNNPAEALQAGLDLLPLALGPDGPSLATLPVALIIGLVGVAWRHHAVGSSPLSGE